MKKEKIIFIIIGILVIIFASIGGSMAYWSWETSEEQRTNVVVDIPMVCQVLVDGGGNVDSSTVKMMPTTCTNTKNAIIKKIDNDILFVDSEIPVRLELKLHIDSISPELTQTQHFKYAVTKFETDCVTDAVSSGTFYGKVEGDEFIIIEESYLKEDDSASIIEDDYYLYIWLDKEETDVATAGTSFSLSLKGTCTTENLEQE